MAYGLAVLATVSERPMHPYEMATVMRGRGKERDMGLKWGSLYTVVRSLHRHGFLMNRGATAADIRREVDAMKLGPLNAALTPMTLSGLRRRAYSADHFRVAAAASAFGTCEVRVDGLSLEIRLPRGD